MKSAVFTIICIAMVACSNQAGSGTTNSGQDTTKTETPTTTAESNNPPAGVITLQELFANKEQYNGKSVRVSGKVRKVNKMIMNRNWVHISDGTLQDNTVDLTVTTQEELAVDQDVTVEGVIATDKDFGSGYKYTILMEDAKVISK